MRYVPALLLDALLVLVFAVIGRASHDEDPGGFVLTAWPFLVALVVGHGVSALLPARPRRPWALAWGAVVWVVTVAGGMLLRLATGDTAQTAFIIVAAVTLGILLIGWRAAAALLRRRRRGGEPEPEPEHQGSDGPFSTESTESGDPGLHPEAGHGDEGVPGTDTDRPR